MKIVFSMIFAASLLSSFALGQTTGEPGKLPADNAVAQVAPGNERYRIGYQDVLNIQIYRHPDLSQTVPVSPNGTIQLFRLDEPIVAVCHTEEELAAKIAAAYKVSYLKNPIIKVSVAEQKSQAIGILGAVEKPATYYVNRRVHLLEMLALAGGPNKEAGTRLIIARTGSSSKCKRPGDDEDDEVAYFTLKVRDVREGKATFWLKPGDMVSVLDADLIYVYGHVNRQGSFKVREPITLRQAIVNAEGLKGAAKKDKVRILRQKEGSVDRQELVFDLNQIDKGKIPDPYLQPDDIVAVTEDPVKSILHGLANAVKGAAPNVIYRLPMP